MTGLSPITDQKSKMMMFTLSFNNLSLWSDLSLFFPYIGSSVVAAGQSRAEKHHYKIYPFIWSEKTG